LFTAETIAFWERLAGYLAVAIAKSRTEKKLRESEARYRSLFENNLDGIFLTRSNGADEDANPAACSMLGMSREEIARVGRAGVLDPNDPRFPALLEQRDRMGRINCELTCIRKDGQKFPAEISSVVLDGDDEERQAFVMVRDITERKRAEQEKLDMERHLLHAQKLESLGILAGGIAHDFNNILAGIMGYADLVKVQLPASEPARKDVDIIKKATRRAADLTRQMLAYSGKGKFIVEPVSLSRVVKDMRAMLAMSISKKATLNCNLASDLPMIEADASQIHQIILNLVINASEALGEDSGVITISTDTIQCSGTDCAALGGDELREGLYVRLEVSDTGCGMDEETLAKIFDPFFTTKFTGRGLGLAAVHGILRGHKGGIRVTSKPGQGTTFQVLFPAIETPALLSAGEPSPAKPWHGTGTVLVVDDEEIVRSLAKKMVEVAGFSVLTANDGEEAVRLYRKHQDEIACVLLDLTMPKLNGEETFRAIRQISPGVRVILSSGYGEEFATGRFSGMGLAGFIQKPYQLDTMIATLREAMGENEGDHPARLRQ
jgi:PAS domain S-box-containing protein